MGYPRIKKSNLLHHKKRINLKNNFLRKGRVKLRFNKSSKFTKVKSISNYKNKKMIN